MERNWKELLIPNGEEKPLDTLCTDGGMSSIFRTVGCVGDSLSSGEFEATNEAGEKTYHEEDQLYAVRVLAYIPDIPGADLLAGHDADRRGKTV